MKTLKEALKDVQRLSQQSEPEADPSIDIADHTADDMPDVEPDPADGDMDIDLDDEDTDMTGADDEVRGDPGATAGEEAPWATAAGVGGSSVDVAGAEEGDGEEPTGEQVSGEEDKGLDAVADKASEDPDRQGVIRNVKGAHLVYKREGDDGTFEELWIYNVSTLQDEIVIRKAILAGTDIPTNKPTSPDGAQRYSMWSAGNAEMLLIVGLQN